jgi:deazaflavin-dependent oxidoreductase (nitroreductase family)
MTDFNSAIIDEFRANDGQVGGPFAHMPMLLLTTTGARSGQPRTSPLAYLRDGGRLHVFGTKGGSDEDPLWYRNLLADPTVTVEVGTERFTATAAPVTGSERDRLWAAQVAAVPSFGDYPKQTTRLIPVIALDPDLA